MAALLERELLFVPPRSAISLSFNCSAGAYPDFSHGVFFAPKGVAIPVAVSAFPDEIYTAPRSWAERAYPKLVHYRRLDRGGHFAAWEQPELFATELRDGFRSLRTS